MGSQKTTVYQENREKTRIVCVMYKVSRMLYGVFCLDYGHPCNVIIALFITELERKTENYKIRYFPFHMRAITGILLNRDMKSSSDLDWILI